MQLKDIPITPAWKQNIAWILNKMHFTSDLRTRCYIFIAVLSACPYGTTQASGIHYKTIMMINVSCGVEVHGKVTECSVKRAGGRRRRKVKRCPSTENVMPRATAVMQHQIGQLRGSSFDHFLKMWHFKPARVKSSSSIYNLCRLGWMAGCELQ